MMLPTLTNSKESFNLLNI